MQITKTTKTTVALTGSAVCELEENMSDTLLSVPPRAEVLQTQSGAREEKNTYGQVLKSSALVGGSSLVNIGIGIARTKAMALLLGPAGVGLAGLYGSIVDLAVNIGGLGVNSSGVRQIAEAVGSHDEVRAAQTTVVLRRTSIALGLMGAALLFAFSRQVSKLTFGGTGHAAAISLLSLAVLFRLVSAGQGALIQGMRRIADLAKMGVLGALFGTVISIVIVYFFRENGVAPSLVAVAAMAIGTSWWYSRKIRLQTPAMTMSLIACEAAPLLKLGFAFMSSGLMTLGVAYAVRIILLRKVGFEATGLYQSAWALGGLYVGFILQAMGADFYPRLTARAGDNQACNRLVNEQALVGLLMAGPGVIATLTFAPLVIEIFYSHKFGPAVELLRWVCLGTMLQVITWPMGFIIIAKGKQTIFFWCEVAWAVASLPLAWLCISHFGLNGAGIAFFGSYIFHGIMIYPTVHWLSGFRWSAENKRTGLLFLSLIALVFCGSCFLSPFATLCVGTLVAVLSGIYSTRMLLRLISLHDYSPQHPIRRLLRAFGFLAT